MTFVINLKGPVRKRRSASRACNVPEVLESRRLLSAVLVRDVNTDPATSEPGGFCEADGTLYFAATDDSGGRELWRTDGTADGTRRVKDVARGPTDSNPTRLTNVNGVLYFVANDGPHGAELWRSDGTDAGTALVRDLVPSVGSSDPQSLTNFNGTLFFVAPAYQGGQAVL